MGEWLNGIIVNKINELDLEKNNCEQIIDKLKELMNSEKKEQMLEEVAEDVKKEYNDLLDYKQQAEQEINQNGAGKQEAENDLVKIENRLKEILEKELNEYELILENVNIELIGVQNDLNTIEELEKNNKKLDKEAEELDKEYKILLKYKKEAEQEINQNGAGKQEAENDLLNIDKRINEILNIDEKNIEEKTKIQTQINGLEEKYKYLLDIKRENIKEEVVEQNVDVDIEFEQEVDVELEQGVEVEAEQEAVVEEEQEADLEEEQESNLEEEQEADLEDEGWEKKFAEELEKINKTFDKEEKNVKTEQGDRARVEQEGKAKEVKQTKVKLNPKGENVNIKKDSVIGVNYLSKEDKYKLTYNGIEFYVQRTKLDNMDLDSLLSFYDKKPDECKNVDEDLMRLFVEYDKVFGDFDIDAYLDFVKEPENNKMQITYDLRNIYDGIYNGTNLFSDQERLTILERANKAKKLGIATVKKGVKVSILEKIDKLISKLTMKKIDSGEKSKEKLAKMKDVLNVKDINKNKAKAKSKTKIKNRPKINYTEKVQRFVKKGKDKVVSAVKSFKKQYEINPEMNKESDSYFDKMNKAAGEAVRRANNRTNQKEVNKVSFEEHDELDI